MWMNGNSHTVNPNPSGIENNKEFKEMKVMQ